MGPAMAGPKNLVKPGFGAERMALFTRRESAIGPYLTTAPVQDLQPVTETAGDGSVSAAVGLAMRVGTPSWPSE
jgi:hypothetical protein